MNKKIVLYIFGGIAYLAIVLYLASIPVVTNADAENILQYHYNTYYNGKIVRKYIDKKNHDYEKLVLDNGQEVVLPAGYLDLFETLSVGDSMFKASNSYIGTIYQRNDTIIMDYERWIIENLIIPEGK